MLLHYQARVAEGTRSELSGVARHWLAPKPVCLSTDQWLSDIICECVVQTASLHATLPQASHPTLWPACMHRLLLTSLEHVDACRRTGGD